ncbi:hypothetical protein GYH30_045386 [Glycine max]|uniref:Uncharacterized protein n=1 Tax=Glycine max TaxID=3847 RepID=A0A0R0FS15_SOYBN|nr:hypothetical protein GYH30_045386 [Glycine max]
MVSMHYMRRFDALDWTHMLTSLKVPLCHWLLFLAFIWCAAHGSFNFSCLFLNMQRLGSLVACLSLFFSLSLSYLLFLVVEDILFTPTFRFLISLCEMSFSI